jgi:hypothetical protein
MGVAKLVWSARMRHKRIETPGCFGGKVAFFDFVDQLAEEVSSGRRTREWYSERLRAVKRIYEHERFFCRPWETSVLDKDLALHAEYKKFVARLNDLAALLPAPYQAYLAKLPDDEERHEALCRAIDKFDVAEELFRGYLDIDLIYGGRQCEMN